MTYLEKIEQRDVDKKKVVSARVSEDVLSALNIADEESENFGYTFSVTKVIEKALNDTLLEIKDTTGVDYYEWVKWQKKMKMHYEMFLNFIDTKNYTHEVSRVISFKDKPFKDYSYLPKPNLSASDIVSHSQQGISPEILKRMKMTNDNTNPWPTIDLHGQKIEEACKSLSSFIHHHNDERFIHIIHGKGHRLDDGLSILKSQVIHYLKQHPKVLAFCSCQQNLGGTGAVLAYIKNNIDYDVIDPMLWISEKTSDFDSLLQNAEEELIKAWNMALESQNINVQAVAEKEGVIFVNKDSDLFRELVVEGKALSINNSNKRSESDE